MIPNELIIIAGMFISAGLGALATAMFSQRRVRRAVNETIREMENLHHARKIQDRRDNTSARLYPWP